MSKVFVSVGMSLDGFIAGPNRSPKNPLGDGGISIHTWLFRQRAFLETHDMGTTGETGEDNRFVEGLIARAGANIMGKRMFEEGEASWPENAPFHGPVFVHTRELRAPWPRLGGTTFYFVQDDIDTVLARAKEAAGAKDVRISGGANVIAQYVNAGLVDELCISLAPVLLGDGLRLFDAIDRRKIALQHASTLSASEVTHLRYLLTKDLTRL